MDVNKQPSTNPQRTHSRAEQVAPNDRGEGWIEAFSAQVAGRTLRRDALRFARGCVRMLESCGALVASSHAEELVADTIGDTWQGLLSWNPDELPLVEHVKAAVRSRVRAEWRRAKRGAHVSLDAHEDDEDDERAAGLWSEAEEALGANAAVTDSSRRILAVEVLDRLSSLAESDAEVLALLEAMRAGATERAELAQMTGMPVRRYESARRRLDRLLMELPAHVWSSARRPIPRRPAPRPSGAAGPGGAAARATCCAGEREPLELPRRENNSSSIPTARSFEVSYGVLVEDRAVLPS